MAKHPITINLSTELDSYNLTGKWNNYISVQKVIIGILKSEGFFKDNIVTNIDSGMVIRISTKGIRETLGSSNRFQTLPRMLKELKIATLRSLPDLIETGTLTEDNITNFHGDNNTFYAYIINHAIINNQLYRVRISIKKKIGSNLFWIHNVDYANTGFLQISK